MKIIQKKSTAPIPPINGTVSDTLNVQDKTTNAPSIRLVEEMVEEVYSTTETKIGTWINGKPLYRKVVNIGNLPNATEKDVAHNISNIKNVIKIYGYAGNGENNFPLPMNSSSSISSTIYLFERRGSVYVGAGTDRSSYSGYAILEYTKTTD